MSTSLRGGLTCGLIAGFFLVAVPAVPAWIPSTTTILRKATPFVPTDVRLTLEEVTADGGRPRILTLEVSRSGLVLVRRTALGDAAVTGKLVPLPTSTSSTNLAGAPAWVAWLGGMGASALAQRLKVDRARRSLAHAGQTIYWVVGTGPRQELLPSITLDRATGRLVSLTEDTSSGPLRVEFVGRYEVTAVIQAWPAAVIFHQARRAAPRVDHDAEMAPYAFPETGRRFRVREVTENVDLPATFFEATRGSGR